MEYVYKTRGTCSSQITLEIDSGIIKSVKFLGGCNGNLKGIGVLAEGMKADEVAARFKGIRCGMKSTSCPDQLALAIEAAKADGIF